jgi:hypothetical protein
LEGTAVGLAAARALGVGLVFGAASVDAALGVIVALAGDAGAAGLVSVLATASAGILSGIGHRIGIVRGGRTMIILTRSSRERKASAWAARDFVTELGVSDEAIERVFLNLRGSGTVEIVDIVMSQEDLVRLGLE